MTLNKKCPFLPAFLMLLGIVLFAFGCAVRDKPHGGPKDVTPPKLLKATPANQTHNFSSRVIQLDFDEYFKLVNPFQEITISPDQEKQPDYNYTKKLGSLIITLKDSLKKNTTYVINFGKALADLHEGNVLKNFTYVFSTGTHIDSLSIAGSVTNVLTQTKEKDVTVMLFTLHEDSLMFGKKKPSVYTTTDTAGNFTLGNLHEGVYKLYALKEVAPDKIFNRDEELIGFPNKVINLQNDTAGIQLKLFKPIPTKFHFIAPKFDADGKILLIFNRPLEKPAVRIIDHEAQNADKYVDISKTRDTAAIYVKNMDFDSLKVAVFENNKSIDTTTLRKSRKETFIRVVTAATSADRGLLKPGTDLNITFSLPVVSYEPSLIVLNEDSTVLSNYTIIKDTANLKHLSIKYPWRQNATYTLTLNEGAVTTYFGDKNKKLPPKKFKIDKPENYGQLSLKITVPDTTKGYVVEFLNDQNNLLRSDVIRKNTTLVYKGYLAGKYHIRVVYDDNKNGKWDAGSIKENRQPENIWVNKNVILLIANFESNQSLDIPREPTP